ncbi:MAG: argininosuccinate lyase [Candidatus Lambdaproteobacteria bacterium]|nr:argininosuccinate lyase [Candidatus Lambdaproteobacteria bacterium]
MTKKQIWGGHLAASPDELMIAFCAGRDTTPLPMADAALLPFDLWTNRAHAIMLHRQGILSAAEARAILAALGALEAEAQAGRFALDPALEDVHVNVERYVTARAGADAGGRLHTGRSRNDQVATDMRLYLRGVMLEFGEGLHALGATLLDQARAHAGTVMPGFTHHQPAMFTTWGHWLCSYAQALCRDLERVRLACDLLNRSPLGAAAAFGTSWPVDRELTAALLAFDRVELNTLDAVTSRWEAEAQAAYTFAGAMAHLALIAQDLILLSHPYWGMVRLADRYVTGSSIMPQKRNPDFAEVLKGKSAWVAGMVGGLLGVPRGLMSGYNRDTQITKAAAMDVARECLPAPHVLRGAMASLTVRPEAMRARLGEGFLVATDFADALARALGLPFRASYEIAAAAVRLSGAAGTITAAAAREALQQAGHDPTPVGHLLAELADPARVLAWRRHTGSPAPAQVRAQVRALGQELAARAAFLAERRREIEAAWERCRGYRITGKAPRGGTQGSAARPSRPSARRR